MLGACDKNTDNPKDNSDNHKFVVNYTHDFNDNEPLKIRFSEKIPENYKTNVSSLRKCISFNRRIDFTVSRLNDYELQIEVDNVTKLTGIRKVIINNRKLFNLTYDSETGLPVKIKVNQITKLEPDFDNLGDKTVFKAMIELKDKIPVEDLKKAVSLQLNNKDIPFTVSEIVETDRQYLVESSEFVKSNKNQIIYFKISDNVFPLDMPINKEYNVASLHSMQVLSTYNKLVENKGTIEILFSEELDHKQDINSYIFLKYDTKEIEFTSVKQFDRIIITGNLETGKNYDLHLKSGIRNKYGNYLIKDFKKEISISDVSPYIAFTESGNIYTSKGNNTVRVRSVNYSKINVSVFKITDENVGRFLFNNSINPNNYYLDDSNFCRRIVSNEFETKASKNKWIETDLDLNKIIGSENRGMYILSIRGYSVIEGVHANKASERAVKGILISDLGITYKKEKGNKHKVIVTDLINAKPESGSKVKVFDKQNVIIASGVTNTHGMFDFEVEEREYESGNHHTLSYITAENNNSRTVISPGKMEWNTSTFDVAGIKENESGSSYVYTERGVYRPGDEINFTLVLRSKEGSIPDNQPVNIKIMNPKRAKIISKTIKNGKDGVYTLSYTTDENAPTGSWYLNYSSGGIKGRHLFKVETVVAERLKVEINSDKDVISADDKKYKVSVESKYLFGAPASNLRYILKAEISKVSKKITELPGFVFDDRTTSFRRKEIAVEKGKLDNSGKADIEWKIPEYSSVPAALMARLNAEVTDVGGRASKAVKYIDINPYKYYVGIKLPDGMHIRKSNTVKVALIDEDGNQVPGENLTLSVYHRSRYWWYERGRTQRNTYKEDKSVSLVFSKNLKSSVEPVEVDINVQNWGEYLIEVTHNISGGHTAAQYFYPYWYGSRKNGAMDEGILSLKTDKTSYKSGETAKIQFDAPEKCIALVSLESNGKILKTYWDDPVVKDGKGEVRVRVDYSMIPNGYCTISVIQELENNNDLPLRTYGVVPLKVFDAKTKNKISITSKESLNPGKKFDVEIQTERKEKSQVTIAVVDEGLLSLTNFKKPDPWDYFHRKLMHSVRTYDNYGFVSGIPKGDPFRSYIVGGDMDSKAAFERNLRKRKKLDDMLKGKKKRFKPVCMFSGILETDENGYLKHEFTMPEYIGAVRIMVVLVKGKTYDSAEKTVPVKEDLMVKATLPRFLNTKNKFMIPVEIFRDNDKKDIKVVNVKIETDDRIKIIGSDTQKITLDSNGQGLAKFNAETDDVFGFSTISIRASSGRYSAESTTDIKVYSPNPSIMKSENKQVAKGGYVEFTIPDDGYPGSMDAVLSINTLENLDLSKRLKWLIRYPYGCIEQTTSSVFPQLYLSEFIKTPGYSLEKIDSNINSAINRLRKFQIPSGGLGYWQGSSTVCDWGTMYAGHFLIEAKKKGYFVPADLMNCVTNRLKHDSKRFVAKTKKTYLFRTQVMRLYLLAMADQADVSSMNIIFESYLSKLNRTYRLLLAAAYKKIGDKKTSDLIISKIDVNVEKTELKEYWRTSWGSSFRDEGLTLIALNDLDMLDEAYTLFNSIAKRINENTWYSTQTLGYNLTALGKYYVKNKDLFAVDNELSCYVEFEDKTRKNININDNTSNTVLENRFGERVKVFFKKSKKLKQLYLSLNWSGVIRDEKIENVSDNIYVSRKFKNSKGKLINPELVSQGDVINCEITVRLKTNLLKENIALVQALPAGWEIENERLTGGKNTSSKYDYMDIRDDRIMWFFSLNGRANSKTLKFKVRAVTCGEFLLPPTYCEAMYDNNYKAVLKGHKVKVTEKQ